MWNYILGSSISLIILIVLTLLIYYIINRRSIKRRKKHFEELHTSIKTGSEVIFSGGIYGKVIKVYDDYIDIQIKSGPIMKVSRYAISDIVK